jgi:hypothetical protein
MHHHPLSILSFKLTEYHSSRWTTHQRQFPIILECLILTYRALFENYDQDLKQLIASLKGKLEGDVKQLKGGM